MDKYLLIGIGHFSSGFQEIWKLRYNLLKYALQNTKKKITVICAMNDNHAYNIMNSTVYDRNTGKNVKYDGFKLTPPGQETNHNKYSQYIDTELVSDIFLKIVKYVRKNTDRINLIGVHPDLVDFNNQLYRQTKKHAKIGHINFIWAHNVHISDSEITRTIQYNADKHYAGYKLRKYYGKKYLMVLSQAYSGELRFIGKCEQKKYMNCEGTKFFTKKFKLDPNSKKIYGFAEYYYENNNGVLYEHEASPDIMIYWKTVTPLVFNDTF